MHAYAGLFDCLRSLQRGMSSPDGVAFMISYLEV